MGDVSDPYLITCHFKVNNLDKARAFTHSPDAEDSQTKSGIIGEPLVLWLKQLSF